MMQAHAIPQTAYKTPQPGAKPMLQRKVKLGSANDPLEHEADRAAAEVVSGASVSKLSRSVSLAQRKCSACEDEERHAIRRKCAHCEAEDAMLRRKGGSAARQSSVDNAATAVRSGGTPLTPQQRSYFEPRFGHDFSEVRLHRGEAAERAADGIGAKAYTLGSSIAFGRGESGNALLAHELAHVVQQSGRTIRRQPAGLVPVDTSGGGSTAFLNTVSGAPTLQPDGTFTGSVRRQEIAPATATQAQMTISDETVNVIYDPKNCVVRLPFRINFVAAPSSGTAGICSSGGAGPAPLVSPARLAEIANEVVETAQDGLNGWFKLRVSGCKNPCAGRDIPIRVEVSQTPTNPDVTINVVNRGGRADAGTICAPDFNPGTTVHEGGHQRLGVGDEYRETNAAYRARTPAWARDERVRTDFTRMGSQHTYGRLAAFHERHFQFAQVFVQAALGASCKVDLARARGLPVEARFTLGVGGFSGNLGQGYTLEAGVDAALPFDTNRRFNLEAGLHALYLRAPEKNRDALLFGARLGLSAQTHPSSWGAKVGVFAGVGGIVWPDKEAYGEVGARIGIFDDMRKGRRVGLELDAALGKAFSDDADKLHFARIGLNFVYSR
ncbi:DUF4157 domain-containing protein [Rhizobium grahamii]|uniref:eCIS core domain-containing protein n=1 Tax=Rhizobium grahamii TaxID=1120045 RepID=A0A370KGQ4_9HYPH|nr:DUF4157 domain-containing protein [Rhizobium grahamii]RDJ03959.1 hypothetical protein B5K06_29085 [Rhizobium grahamii]